MSSWVVQNDSKCLKDEMVTMAHAHSERGFGTAWFEFP
jgi:hypothetical protein